MKAIGPAIEIAAGEPATDCPPARTRNLVSAQADTRRVAPSCRDFNRWAFVLTLLLLASCAPAQFAIAQPEEPPLPLSTLPKTNAPLEAPIYAPRFPRTSTEARLSLGLNPWRAAMRARRPIEAKSWVVMDADSGRVLASHNADAKMFPASTTKTLTALTALLAVGEKGLDRVVTIGPNPPRIGEQSINLLQGEKFTLRDLLQAAMIKSANDSCVAIAEGVAGTVPKFAAMMNARAREIGAVHSNFVNPHGLHDPNHYSTARDLALIARAAMRFPFFNQMTRTRETSIHGNWKLGPVRVLANRNRLLWRWNECDGVKTGYTKQAGRCLIAAATRNVKSGGKTRPFRVISVVMHARDGWSDSTQLLLYQGFAKFHPVPVAQAGQEFGKAEVEGGAAVAAIAERTVTCAARKGKELEQRVHLRTLRAPLKKGALVGTLDLYDEGRHVARVPLIAQNDVALSLIAQIAPPVEQALPESETARRLLFIAAGGALFYLLHLARKARNPNHGRSEKTSKPESREEFLQRLQSQRGGARGVGAQHDLIQRGASQRKSARRPSPQSSKSPNSGDFSGRDES